MAHFGDIWRSASKRIYNWAGRRLSFCPDETNLPMPTGVCGIFHLAGQSVQVTCSSCNGHFLYQHSARQMGFPLKAIVHWDDRWACSGSLVSQILLHTQTHTNTHTVYIVCQRVDNFKSILSVIHASTVCIIQTNKSACWEPNLHLRTNQIWTVNCNWTKYLIAA